MAGFMPQLSIDLSAESAQGVPAGMGPPASRAPPVPMSTPRRRLRAALDMEKAICAKLEQQGWNMIIRAGKKIGKIYALVTGYTKFPDVRLAVYQTNNCQIQELIFRSETDLAMTTPSNVKKIINDYLAQYTFNYAGCLVKKDTLINSAVKDKLGEGGAATAGDDYASVLKATQNLNLQSQKPMGT